MALPGCLVLGRPDPCRELMGIVGAECCAGMLREQDSRRGQKAHGFRGGAGYALEEPSDITAIERQKGDSGEGAVRVPDRAADRYAEEGVLRTDDRGADVKAAVAAAVALHPEIVAPGHVHRTAPGCRDLDLAAGIGDAQNAHMRARCQDRCHPLDRAFGLARRFGRHLGYLGEGRIRSLEDPQAVLGRQGDRPPQLFGRLPDPLAVGRLRVDQAGGDRKQRAQKQRNANGPEQPPAFGLDQSRRCCLSLHDLSSHRRRRLSACCRSISRDTPPLHMRPSQIPEVPLGVFRSDSAISWASCKTRPCAGHAESRVDCRLVCARAAVARMLCGTARTRWRRVPAQRRHRPQGKPQIPHRQPDHRP